MTFKIPSLLASLALAAVAFAFVPAQAQQKNLKVAAAADLQPVMPALASAYEKKTGIKLEVSFGSSGALTTQIQNGAPFDIFLGADFVFPEKVIASGLAVEKLPVGYARGTLVLWARKDLPVPLIADILRDPRITRVAVADEFHAPYGRAAYAALRQLKLYDLVKPKLVTGENIAQTAQFVQTGNAQVGFISLTLASSEKFKQDGHYVRIPESSYPEIRQCAVVMKKAQDVAEAEAFLAWLRGPDVQSHLKDFGLEPVR